MPPRLLQSILASLFVGALSGCAERAIDECPPEEPCWLQLQSWVTVDEAEGTLDGFLRWVYVSDDPAATEVPEEVCGIWERLALDAIEPEGSCEGCTRQYEGVAVVDADATTCPDLSWRDRAFALGFSPLDEAAPELAALGEEGFVHLVHSPWTPEVAGEGTDFAPLFTGRPEAWTDADASAGSDDAATPSGEYQLRALAYWDRTGEE